MLKPKYISPSSLTLFEKDPASYYLRYFLGAAGFPTTEPMACGTGFDCFVKSHIASVVGADFDLEEQLLLGCTNRRTGEVRLLDWAREAGRYVFKQYQESGALARLMLMVERREGAVRFESGVSADIQGVPVFGKPDMFWAAKSTDLGGGGVGGAGGAGGAGALVMLDWKVNGVMAKNGISPNKGYSWEWPSGKTHKLANVEGGCNMEDLNTAWADQVGIYALALLGSVEEAAKCWYIIDQTVGTGVPNVGSRTHRVPATGDMAAFANETGTVPFIFPKLRFATFKCHISEEYLRRICRRLVDMWKVVSYGPTHELFARGRDVEAVQSNKDVGFMF